MKFLKFFSILVVAAFMTSCLGSSESTTKEDFTGYCFNYVTDMSNGESEMTWGGTYTLDTNYTDGTSTLTIANLKVPGSQSLSIQLPNLKYKFDEKGGVVIKEAALTSSYNGQRHTVTDLSFTLYRRYINTSYFPVLWLTFTVDSQYRVRVVYTPSSFVGTTNVVGPDNSLYTSQKPYYCVAFDPTKSKATLHVIGAKFADKMPALDMMFTDIPFTCSQTGFDMAKAELIPRIGNVEYPDFKITDLKVSGNYEMGLMVEFTCTIDTKMMKGAYKVSANLEVVPAVTEQPK